VNAIQDSWEEMDSASCSGSPTLATDERHMEQVKCFMPGNCYRSQNISSQCLLSSHQQLRKTKFCAKWFPHVLNSDQRAMHVLAATDLQHWKSEGSVFLSHILTIDESWMHSFEAQLK
jgi:hypothetical protein